MDGPHGWVDRFIGLAAAALGASAAAAGPVAEDLLVRYAEPHRRYHTAEHLAEVVAELDRFRAAGWLDDGLAPVVELAAWFHDAIYDVGAPHGGSEAASAALAVGSLTAMAAEGSEVGAAAVADEVDRLIRLTVGHLVGRGDVAGAALVDADLWILSAPTERYDRYVADVRAEYAHVPDELWVPGRSAVLAHFLGHVDELYVCGDPDDRTARRQRAVANLQRERADLEG